MTTEQSIRAERYKQKTNGNAAGRLIANLNKNSQVEQKGEGKVASGLSEISAPEAAGDPIVAGQFNESTVTTILQSEGFGSSFLFPLALYVRGLVDATGIRGESETGLGLMGESDSGVGVQGRGNTGTGVIGVSDQGVGVSAGSVGKEAINALSLAGDGVRATTQSHLDAAVFAENSATTPGFGATGLSAHGGVGVGVYASGGQAPVQLEHSAFVGPPPTGAHEAGEIVLDAKIDLYLCKQSGTPGIWKRIG